MNAVDTSTVPAPAGGTHSTHPTSRFRLLLRREYWEHKGGFLWAPLIAGGISLALAVMAAIVGVVMLNRAAAAGDIQINGVDLGMLTREMSPSDAEQLALGLDWSLIMSSAWPFIVLTFVVFFYCLGALYDDRKDRSVLFWKSLPISDAQTVLSKVASAVVVAPVLAVLTAVVTMFGFLVLMSVMVMMFGGNPFTLLWAQSHPLRIAFGLLAWVPVYAVWALPTVGWLLLCSAWVRSKPFLWAVLVPGSAFLLNGWLGMLGQPHLSSSILATIAERALLGLAPAASLSRQLLQHTANETAATAFQLHWGALVDLLGSAQLWIGVVIGLALLAGATWARARRIDTSS